MMFRPDVVKAPVPPPPLLLAFPVYTPLISGSWRNWQPMTVALPANCWSSETVFGLNWA